MTVHFIGAGPGAADLITVRGRDLIARCPVCLYAGSIVPRELLAHCPPGARIVDTAPLSLDEIEAEFVAAHAAGLDVARLHSGDLSIYSALAEQLRRLERHGIPYTLTPGVPAFAAAAAALECELTVPEVAQSVVLTRVSGRASRMPETRKARDVRGKTGATLVIHLAIHAIETIVDELTPFYGADCPAAVVVQASSPDERILRGTLADIAAKVAAETIERTALILVGPRARGGRFSRQRALRRRLSPPVPRRRRVSVSLERRAADQILPSRSNSTISMAMSRPATTRAAVCLRRARDRVAERDAFALAPAQKPPPPCWPSTMRRAEIGRAAGRFGKFGQRREIDLAALGMQIEQALRELGHLGDAARDGDARHRMARADI